MKNTSIKIKIVSVAKMPGGIVAARAELISPSTNAAVKNSTLQIVAGEDLAGVIAGLDPVECFLSIVAAPAPTVAIAPTEQPAPIAS